MVSEWPEIKVPPGRREMSPSPAGHPWEATGEGEKGRLAQRGTELPWKSRAEI